VQKLLGCAAIRLSVLSSASRAHVCFRFSIMILVMMKSLTVLKSSSINQARVPKCYVFAWRHKICIRMGLNIKDGSFQAQQSTSLEPEDKR
jgi:hypothetical protein